MKTKPKNSPATGTFISTRSGISRRRFLRGAGIMLSLPLLDSMVPAFARSAHIVKANFSFGQTPSHVCDLQ